MLLLNAIFLKTQEITYQLNQINSIAKTLLDAFNSKTILFNGEMGAGKTTLIKAILKSLNSDDDVSSPTFSIVNEYKIPNDKVYHFDFYRIESIEEALNFGVEDYLYSDHWLLIEWSERVSELIPEDHCKIDIIINSPEERTLKLTINNKKLTKRMPMHTSQ